MVRSAALQLLCASGSEWASAWPISRARPPRIHACARRCSGTRETTIAVSTRPPLASDPEGSRLRDKLLLLASVSRDYEPPPIDARLRTLQENLSRRERPALDRALGSVNRVMTRRRCRSQPTSRAPADCWRPSPSSVSPRIRELEHRHPRSRPAKLSLTRRLLKRWPSTSSPG